MYVIATGAEDIHRCLVDGGLLFTINCPSQGRVIRILSAKVAFGQRLSYDNDGTQQCQVNVRNCTLSSRHVQKLSTVCNELPICHFSPVLLNDPECSPPRAGNVTNVIYECIERKYWLFYDYLPHCFGTALMDRL